MELNSEDSYRLHRRFDRMGRLVGDRAMERLIRSHVMIFGLGGVGSWAAESIVRSGVGCVTIIDFDEICITNSNRQLHALAGLVGQKKADIMAERLRKVNPQARIDAITKFYNADSSDEIFSARPDFVIDAIDHITSKCHLLARCRKDAIPAISSTGSGGRIDPTRIRVADLAETESDPLAKSVRRILREQYEFPREGQFGIAAVYSDEPYSKPRELSYDGGKGFKCLCTQGDNPYFTCDNRNLILGNASFVTGAFGFACASFAVRKLIEDVQDK